MYTHTCIYVYIYDISHTCRTYCKHTKIKYYTFMCTNIHTVVLRGEQDSYYIRTENADSGRYNLIAS